MNYRKRTLDSTDLFLSNPSSLPSTRKTKLLSSVYSSPFLNHSVYQAHHSCVNALAISPGEGRWLASGGDDKRVILSEALVTDDEGTLGEPRAWYQGAQSNIFAIDFDSTGRKLYSAGNDAAIICHDLETSSATLESPGPPSDVWIDNDDSVHGLSCHPSNLHLFLSASSDGTIRQYDSRADTNAVGILADAHEMEGVAYHPLQHELFAYAGEDAHAGLVDSRMAWNDPNVGSEGGRTARPRVAREVSVVNWHVNLVQAPKSTSEESTTPPIRTQRARPAASSLAFSPTGSLVALTLAGHLPTLYALSSASPLATFSAPPSTTKSAEIPSNFPQTYRNACTTKHGSFGGGPDAREGKGLFYAAGSDDFGVYVWEVPTREKMEQGKKNISFGTGDWPIGEEGIGYLAPSNSTTPASLTFPHTISQPSSILRSHRSIPNTTLYHPTLPYLYSCGVEKAIIRHSPSLNAASLPPQTSKWSYTPRIPRAEPTSFLSSLVGPADPQLQTSLLAGETETDRENRLRKEDLEILEYFDELIIGENDFGGVWRDAKAGEIDGLEEEEESSKEKYSSDSDIEAGEEEERLEGEGEDGTTRRILNSIYALEEVNPSEGEEESDDDEEDGSQASLTLSEQAEYQELMRAWDDRTVAGDAEE